VVSSIGNLVDGLNVEIGPKGADVTSELGNSGVKGLDFWYKGPEDDKVETKFTELVSEIREDILLLDYIPIVLKSIEGIVVLLGGRELAEPGPLNRIKETRTIDVIVIVISDIINRKVAN
jgi:hypothetical protein